MKGEKTAIGIQLAHGGRKASSQRAMDGMGPLTAQEIEAGAKVWQPVGPTSEPVAQGWLTPRQLTADECRAMVRTWAQAARNAVKAGFDVIEIHTAHGYLLASFLSPISNTRNDDYGGDRAGRMRLPLEIVEAVRRDTMPLFVRVSAVEGAKDGWNLDDSLRPGIEGPRRRRDRLLLRRHFGLGDRSPGPARPRLPGALRRTGPQGSGHRDDGGGHHSRSSRPKRSWRTGGPT
jgi:hypothetical protein